MALLCVPLAPLPAQPKGFPSAKTPVPSTAHSLRLRCAAAAGDSDATLVKIELNPNAPATPLPRSPLPSSPPFLPPVPVPTPTPTPTPTFGRSSFPAGFSFGAASSNYQIEGATNEDGRGRSIWDTFVQRFPEKISDGSNADKACLSYYRYADDVKLLKNMGMDVYRFSISWPRILPRGSLKGGINKEGIDYYNKLIDELVRNGIKPFVTLFHWDLPQALEDEYSGFLGRRIVEDFKDFSEICFREFGDRVKHWITLNEPYQFTLMGYDTGVGAPGRCSPSQGTCPAGDSATEPYIVAHNLILCHAAAYRLYEKKFKATQNGQVGITLNYTWAMPYSNSKENINAAERLTDFMFGWYMDPIVYGDYPFIMRALVRERLPIFTTEESKLVKGSYDFIGINYYTSTYAYGLPFSPNNLGISYSLDSFVKTRDNKEGVPIGKKTDIWIHIVPEGLLDFLVYTMKKYKNPPIYITENGMAERDNHQLLFEEAIDDQDRIQYFSRHLAKVLEAIRLGVNVKGFMAWSLMDSWEWMSGYASRFGLSYVDYTDRLNRYPKASSQWFSKFLRS